MARMSRASAHLRLLAWLLLAAGSPQAFLATGQVNEEGMVLLSFRQQIVQDPLNVLRNWSIHDSDPCLWTGVVCNEHFEVTKIILNGTQLGGSIPSEISALKHLLVLNLADNNLSGRIPAGLGDLSALKILNLRGNSLTGKIPAQLRRLSRLETLELSHNTLTGPLPGEKMWSNCSGLQQIDLSANRLEEAIPSSIGHLKRLEVLHLGNNLLVGTIPDEIGDCSYLQSLNVSNNLLEGRLPATFASLTNLEVLDVSANRLSGTLLSEVIFQSSRLYVNFSLNLFSGQLPSIPRGTCSSIRIYDLSANKISGVIPPDFGLCPEGGSAERPPVQQIDFSNNFLTGSWPSSGTFASLHRLDLRCNSLSGMLPENIFTWDKLTILDLSQNEFNGRIPDVWKNLAHLVSFNVSCNALSGAIPRLGAFSTFGPLSFLENSGLCGAPVSAPCDIAAHPASRPVPAVTRKHISYAVLAMIAGFCIICVLLCILLVGRLPCRIERRPERTEIRVYATTPTTLADTPSAVGRLVMFGKHTIHNFEGRGLHGNHVENLASRLGVIGHGSLGTVYKARFQRGEDLAVKELSTPLRTRMQHEFEREMERFSNLRHPNLVKLRGYYWSDCMQLIVSDYIPNGSLHYHLHERGDRSHLTWSRRYHIALNTVRALEFLYHGCNPPISHCRVKSTNILLSEDFDPLLSDYGLTKLLSSMHPLPIRRAPSALGYTAPELSFEIIFLPEKCDVYSFGVVLMELITGRPVVKQEPEEVVTVCDYVSYAKEQGRILHCVDGDLVLREDKNEILGALKVALFCTAPQPSDRPSVAEVVRMLEAIRSTPTPAPQLSNRPSAMEVVQFLEAVNPHVSPGSPQSSGLSSLST